jgi:integrase
MLRTKSGLPKHCCWNTDQRGNRYVRFRKDGITRNLTGIPWSEDFMRQYAAALEGVNNAKNDIGADRTKPGSFNALAVAYYRSPEFLRLKPYTQGRNRSIIEPLRHQHGDKPIKNLTRGHINAIVGAKSATPEQANTVLKVLRLLLNFAISIDMLQNNPAKGVKRFKSPNPDGYHAWTEDEFAKFVARHPSGTKPHLAMMLLACTGQRKSDVVRMGWQHIRNGDDGKQKIVVRQQKTNTPLLIPIHPDLKQALAALPRDNLTFIMTEYGKPYSAHGFGNWFRLRCDEAGLPHCSAHGLRKLAGIRMAEAQCTDREMMAVLGHRSVAQLSVYVRGADQSRLAERAFAKQQATTPPKNKS